MNVDTESTPLANPGSFFLRMSRDVLSAAAAEAFEIQYDSSKPDGPWSLTHVSGSIGTGYRIEVVTELAKSHSDSQRAAQQADFIVFPITCLALEVQSDIWSLIEQYWVKSEKLFRKVG